MSQFFATSRVEAKKYTLALRDRFEDFDRNVRLRNCRLDVLLSFLIHHQEIYSTDTITTKITSKFHKTLSTISLNHMRILDESSADSYSVYLNEYFEYFFNIETLKIKKTNYGTKLIFIFYMDAADPMPPTKVEVMIKDGWKELETSKCVEIIADAMDCPALDYRQILRVTALLKLILEVVNPVTGLDSSEFGDQLAKCC